MQVAVLALVSLAASGDSPSYSEDVRPILAEHCFACHGPDPATRAGGVRLDTAEGLHGAAGAGPVVPRDADDSELMVRVTSEYAFDQMPPPEAGERLSADEVAVLRAWIEGGADWEPHWAYGPFRDVEPGVEAASAIDAIVDARLQRVGATAAPAASPRSQLTRAAFDLTGLPPSLESLERFEAEPTDALYVELVEELLVSDAYAQHWARHWLDLARYADSHGFTIDGGRTVWPWRDQVVQAIGRDQPFDQFTIEQLAGDLLPNATREQRIATGFHRNTQINQEGGAGDEENRVSAVLDRVATTGSVWLGSTIGCAQCHTHKFDPITQTEYFGLFAFFNSSADSGVSLGPTVLVPNGPKEAAAALDWETRHAQLSEELARACDAASEGWMVWQPPRATGSNGPELRPEEDGSFRVVGQSPVYSTYVLQGQPPRGDVGALRLEVLPDGGPGRSGGRNFVLQDVRVDLRRDANSPWQRAAITRARATHEQGVTLVGDEPPRDPYPADSLVDGSEGPGWAVAPLFDQPHVIELTLDRELGPSAEVRIELQQEFGDRHTIGAFRLLVASQPTPTERPLVTSEWLDAWTRYSHQRAQKPRLPSTLVMQERALARTTRRFERGSFLDPQEEVRPGFPAAMDHFSDPEAVRPRTRLDLARWLVDPRNALVHRVTVNRWWQQLFGVGIVETENDFGLRGVRPVHPDLLEWLARDYVEHGFSRRHVLRRIVLSHAYRRSSDVAPTAEDPAGRLLTRRTRRRLSGEELRDRMLVSAGVLDGSAGGAPIQPPQPDGVFAFTQSKKSWEPSPEPRRYRRSLYTRLWRSTPFPFYATFDAPSAGVTCTRRTISRTPLQALALANDPMVIELAERFAERVVRELPDAADEPRIAATVRWTLGRDPHADELEPLGRYVASVRDARGEAAAWSALGRVLFNLDEFSHRP